MMKHLNFFVLAAATLLAGCHGSTVTETVGGTVIGLQTTGTSGNTPLQLQNNGVDTITVKSNGSFNFPTALDVGTTYVVTVSQQPEGETCSVENSIGILEENVGNVSSVVVNCISTVSSSDAPYGTVSGLKTGTLTVTVNGIDPLPITNANNAAILSWAFPTALPLGTAFQVAIASQPSGQNCTITNPAAATGTVSNDTSNGKQLQPIIISCT
jgi:hypothetical protein